MHPFHIGLEYQRQALLDFVGSRQAQAGVIWGTREPGCLICTSGGRHGKKAGYEDGQQEDGSWVYIGQGTQGDQEITNAANAKLTAQEKSVLLFTPREPTSKEVRGRGWGKLYSFRGSFNVSGFEFFRPEIGPRHGNRLIKFFLVPSDEIRARISQIEQPAEASETALVDLQRRLVRLVPGPVAARIGELEYRSRSVAIHRYALLRANGFCECCTASAPFANESGTPYLEVHHLRRLADDGPDVPLNVAAVCPNCHRALHLSATRLDLARALMEVVARRERAISTAAC